MSQHSDGPSWLDRLPDLTARKIALGVAGVLGAVGLAFLFRTGKAPEPAFELEREDGAFAIRRYPDLVTADVARRGRRKAALDDGFGALADYIFAKNRRGPKLAMTAPVLSDGAGSDGWRTRFVMPAGATLATLPAPAAGVTLAALPARRVAVVAFSGRADDALLAEQETRLRTWLAKQGIAPGGTVEYAFYDPPWRPGPARRNEVLLPL